MGKDLQTLRKELDALDRSIVDALAERDRLVDSVGALKTDRTQPVRDVSREEALLSKVVEHAQQAGLSTDLVTRLFQDIVDHSLRRQHRRLASGGEEPAQDAPAVIAFQGTVGSYSHQVAARHFGSADYDVELRGFHTFKQAIDAVANGVARFGVLPIENTTAGSINETYDLLAQYNLHMIGEEIHRIEHCLLAVEPVPLSKIRRIFSQAQALAQCTEFLDGLDHCRAVSFTDTAMSCQKIRDDQDLSQAAIASEAAGRIYGLHVIKRGVANQKENYTRFAVVSPEEVAYDLRIPCKTSMVVATRHEKGALLECLSVFARHELNLTKLESRPRPNTPWQYLFYIDFEGNELDEHVQSALQEVKAHAAYMKVLGSYPARTTQESQPAEPKSAPAAAVPAPSAAPEAQPKYGKYPLAGRNQRTTDTIVPVGGVDIGKSPALIARPGGAPGDWATFCADMKTAGADIVVAPRDADLVPCVDAASKAGLPVAASLSRAEDSASRARHADAVWVAAREMNDFELLEAIGKLDCTVVLERGVMASVDEWLAAADFILSCGNQQVVLCESGIHTFEPATRQTLDLSAVPIVRERSHLPIVVAPGACGQGRWVPALARAALAVGAQGIVLDVDEVPRGAAVDAGTLAELKRAL